MSVEELPLFCEKNTARTSGKKFASQIFFQLLDGFADRRLADIKFLSSAGNISGVGNGIENPVRWQVLIHGLILRLYTNDNVSIPCKLVMVNMFIMYFDYDIIYARIHIGKRY